MFSLFNNNNCECDKLNANIVVYIYMYITEVCHNKTITTNSSNEEVDYVILLRNIVCSYIAIECKHEYEMYASLQSWKRCAGRRYLVSLIVIK